MSDKSGLKFIVLPYNSKCEKTIQVSTKEMKHVKTDDIHKFLDYVNLMEEFVNRARKLKSEEFSDLLHKVQKYDFLYVIHDRKD